VAAEAGLAIRAFYHVCAGSQRPRLRHDMPPEQIASAVHNERAAYIDQVALFRPSLAASRSDCNRCSINFRSVTSTNVITTPSILSSTVR